MARLVTINEGFTSIALPDGNLYDEGETATITDAQFARISPVMFDEILTDDGYQSDIVIDSPDGTPYRLVVANDGTLSTEEVT